MLTKSLPEPDDRRGGALKAEDDAWIEGHPAARVEIDLPAWLLGMAFLLAGVTFSTRSALQRNEFLVPDFQVKAGVRCLRKIPGLSK